MFFVQYTSCAAGRLKDQIHLGLYYSNFTKQWEFHTFDNHAVLSSGGADCQSIWWSDPSAALWLQFRKTGFCLHGPLEEMLPPWPASNENKLLDRIFVYIILYYIFDLKVCAFLLLPTQLPHSLSLCVTDARGLWSTGKRIYYPGRQCAVSWCSKVP